MRLPPVYSVWQFMPTTSYEYSGNSVKDGGSRKRTCVEELPHYAPYENYFETISYIELPHGRSMSLPNAVLKRITRNLASGPFYLAFTCDLNYKAILNVLMMLNVPFPMRGPLHGETTS